MKKILLASAIVSTFLICNASLADEVTTVKTEPSVNMSEKNKTDGAAYLAKIAKEPGVVTMPDGLRYKIIKQGTGNKPTADSTVTVNYTGNTIDGKVFDSSVDHGKPATFPVNGVIPGWTEALQLMNKGSVWMLYIPSDLAYGAMGMPPVIGPNQVLVFKVELLDIS